MKLITRIAVIALAAAPLAALAQSEGLTRAQVRQDLQRVEQAGYNPSERDAFYPDNIQAAEQKLQPSTAYGSSSDGTSASGQGATPQNAQ